LLCHNDLEVSSSPLDVHLDQYEGPLDLLLDLIRKQQINIYDIPIAQITSQYLEYMQRAMAMDIELSSEFVYMAATLIHIKSRLLLPRDPELEKISPEEDPRTELVHQLLEHERFRNAAEMLQQKRLVEEAVWSNPQIRHFASEDDVPALDVALVDLVKCFQQVVERAKDRPIYRISTESVSVPDMIRYLHDLLKRSRENESFSATDLFEEQRNQRAMICLFLALLELVRRQALELVQGELFSDIRFRRHPNFEQSEGSAEALAAAEQDYT